MPASTLYQYVVKSECQLSKYPQYLNHLILCFNSDSYCYHSHTDLFISLAYLTFIQGFRK